YYNYYTEIEETFVRRRGKNLLLSPLDWALIESWQERGLPLHVVLRAIETVFDGFDKNPGTRTIKGLIYCREEIEAQYEEWIRMQTGKPVESSGTATDESFSRESVSEHISGIIAYLKESPKVNLRDDFDRSIARLEELHKNLTDDFELVDKTLSDIEKLLDESLLKNSDKLHLKKVGKEITSQLKIYKTAMEPEVYKKTFDLMLLKRLREDEGIPRLSLFYL
ncbi:MAG: hypothetical protein M3Q26_09195, partial [Acidobacteriota bacterium]|nr:hypothetical protein [Acidobacteriota bacterium]